MTDDDVIRIPLRSRDGSVRAWAIVDREDADLAELRWCYFSRLGYAARTEDGTSRYLHRAVLERITGCALPPDRNCDHANGNGLDNRRSNLRLATHSHNSSNRKSADGASSTFLGVGWYPRLSKWQALITTNKRHIYIGVFTDEEDAARAYDRAAREYHGEYARLNFPDEGDA